MTEESSFKSDDFLSLWSLPQAVDSRFQNSLILSYLVRTFNLTHRFPVVLISVIEKYLQYLGHFDIFPSFFKHTLNSLNESQTFSVPTHRIRQPQKCFLLLSEQAISSYSFTTLKVRLKSLPSALWLFGIGIVTLENNLKQKLLNLSTQKRDELFSDFDLRTNSWELTGKLYLNTGKMLDVFPVESDGLNWTRMRYGQLVKRVFEDDCVTLSLDVKQKKLKVGLEVREITDEKKEFLYEYDLKNKGEEYHWCVWGKGNLEGVCFTVSNF
jgi:hypothetical protein